ncbi:hypothetical protein MLD38_036154 [Melastoma candidum]|uniref:Uncharacterized protein n=1 Tax=Melastoma candidum TaxID=119954 RepID=A0ACB9LIB5_9MYRT|nr:hypothetical protein MLD38_036154 [Melastoma candidum]
MRALESLVAATAWPDLGDPLLEETSPLEGGSTIAESGDTGEGGEPWLLTVVVGLPLAELLEEEGRREEAGGDRGKGDLSPMNLRSPGNEFAIAGLAPVREFAAKGLSFAGRLHSKRQEEPSLSAPRGFQAGVPSYLGEEAAEKLEWWRPAGAEVLQP